MKYYATVILLLGSVLAIFLRPATITEAHVLEADSEIGAILHIFPDDNPVTGKKIKYLLSFQDTTKRFSLDKCDCLVVYLMDGAEIGNKALDISYPQDSLNSFMFNKPGVYKIKVTGEPVPGASFQPFVLTYSIRVVSGDIKTNGMPWLLWTGIGSAIGVIMLAAFTMDKQARVGSRS